MKASKEFSYYVNGNEKTLIKEGEEIPEVARTFAEKNGFAEKDSDPKEKSKSTPANKAKQTPKTKA